MNQEQEAALQNKPASVWEAEKTKLEAEAAFHAAEAERQRALARKMAAAAAQEEFRQRKAEIELEKAEEHRKKELAADEYYHVYRFSDEVNRGTVASCIASLKVWDRHEPECDIEIIFSSPGGGIIEGFVLFDFIAGLRDRHKITTVNMGWAASMAGVLLQAGDKRVMGKNAVVLIHEASFVAAGSMGEVEDTIELIKMLQERVIAIFVERSKGKLTSATIKRKWKRKNWWLNAEECLKLRLVDEIV